MRERAFLSGFVLSVVLISLVKPEETTDSSKVGTKKYSGLPDTCTILDIYSKASSVCQTLEEVLCNCSVSSDILETTATTKTANTSTISSEVTKWLYVYTTISSPYEPIYYENDTHCVFIYNVYWNNRTSLLTTTQSSLEITVTAMLPHSTNSKNPTTTQMSSGNSGGQIIDVENRITYSTVSYSSTGSNGNGITTSRKIDEDDVSQIFTSSTTGSSNIESSSPSQGVSISAPASSTSSFDPGSSGSYKSTYTTRSTELIKDSSTTSELRDGSILSSSTADPSTIPISTTPLSDSGDNSSSRDHITTTVDPSCSIKCPDGYIIGSSLCFYIADVSNIKSYQSALSYCQTVNLRNLISLEHLRNLNDLQILRTKSNVLQSTTWFFANGGGSAQERFEKQAQVFDINMLTAMTSPIAMTVGISYSTSNTSAICVLPQYCNLSQCFVDSALNVFELNAILSSSKEIIDSASKTEVTCSYTKAVTTMSCGVRGNMMPNPTTISCEAYGAAQKLQNTTAQLVENCSMCYKRGTESCEEQTDENGKTGFKCNCKGSYSMSTCWYTSDACTPDTCNGHGKCSDTLGDIKCDCDWGYEGGLCEVNKDRVSNTTDAFFKRLGNYILDFPTIYALQTNTWTFLTIFAKTLGKIYVSNGEDDPQETHQAARAFFMTLGTSCVLFFNDPYLFKISQATCRMFFIMIHFCFMGAMIQWMLEGYNANQVVRCVHLNEWEKDFKFRKSLGIMAAPRMSFPLILLALALALVFKSNWYYLPSTWTCLGVICNQTTSVLLSAIWIVLCLVVSTAAFAESSVLLTYRRPLYNLKIRQRIENNVGIIDGWVAEKCRRNTVLCFIGAWLLSITWLFAILASDERSKYFFGWTLTVVSTLYGSFSFFQGLYTDPNTWSTILWFAMKRFPARFAPNFDPISMWTREEVNELTKLPKDQQEIMKDQTLPLNKRIFLHHKWDRLLNEKLENGSGVEEALLEILRGEMKNRHVLSGSPLLKNQLQETFSEFVKSVSERPPRMDLLGVNAKSEAVTLCAEKGDGSARVAKFMLVPDIDVFKPAEFYEDAVDVDKKRLENEVDKECYKIAREEAVSQNKFMNSAIKFKYYGKIKE
ncbi:hypothetical protein L5515_001512 [Caenorhabditis briggsae]|uniref:EGF-like domain-containing protein n=2 Tax=Caenorhabditis briggsae TaxID=6238 RepID=A0AAE9E1P9_CAEBR|nr:hypothetical protein L5515_001512 [Caenorhabditis briggsae]